jgi:hypothetical protein
VTVCNREVRSLKGRSVLESEFGKFDHRTFSIEYPMYWVDVTRKATRVRPLPIVAYGHRNKREGFLGAIADSVSWRLDGEFAVFGLPLKEVSAKIRSEPKSDAGEIIFDYILNHFKLAKTNVEVLGKQKEVLNGRRLYHLTVNDSGRQSEFRLVVVTGEAGILLRHVAPLKTLDDFKETFERIVQSFKIKG